MKPLLPPVFTLKCQKLRKKDKQKTCEQTNLIFQAQAVFTNCHTYYNLYYGRTLLTAHCIVCAILASSKLLSIFSGSYILINSVFVFVNGEGGPHCRFLWVIWCWARSKRLRSKWASAKCVDRQCGFANADDAQQINHWIFKHLILICM